jgi:hypothetical protein
MEFVPILEKLATCNDVRQILPLIVSENKINFNKAFEVLR